MVSSKLVTTVIEEIRNDLKDKEYECLKVGFYACSIHRKMNIFVELVKDSSIYKMVLKMSYLKKL